MADAWEDRIADAVADEINDPARSWHGFFINENAIAANARKAWFELPEIAKLKVSVVPTEQKRTRLTKGNLRQFDYKIAIDLQRSVDPEDMEFIRTLGTHAQAVQEFFDDGHKLTGLTDWISLEALRDDIYNLDALYANGRTWETLIDVTVRGFHS